MSKLETSLSIPLSVRLYSWVVDFGPDIRVRFRLDDRKVTCIFLDSESVRLWDFIRAGILALFGLYGSLRSAKL